MREITQTRFGGPDVLEIVPAPTPIPTATEVLVRVSAVGLNPLEARVRSGDAPLLGEPPFVLGWDVSGVVEESRSWRFRPGDEVFGMPLFPRAGNAYAEYVAVPALQLVKKPSSLSHEEAAALPIVSLTAWQALVDIGRVRATDRVLILGGGGGVGHVAVQIAKAFGARVIATASPAKADFVRALGADEVIDSTSSDLRDAVDEVDIVLDTLGGEPVAQSVDILRRGGLLVTAVDEDEPDLIARTRDAGIHLSGIAVDPDIAALERIVSLVDRGLLRVHIQEVFPFDRIVDAHRTLDRGHLQGKTVLTLAESGAQQR